MRASNTSCKVDLFDRAYPSRADNTRRRPIARITGILFLIILLAGSFYLAARTSASRNLSNKPKEHVSSEIPAVKGILNSPVIKSITPLLLPQTSPPTVTTYASDCTTPKALFNVQDTDKTVCAKVENATPGWQVIWSNASFRAVQTTSLTSGNQNVTFTLNTNSSLGDWRVILYEPFGGGVYSVPSFTVIDEANPVVDLQIDASAKTETASAGSQAVFAIQVTNAGPSSASAVDVSDDIPANTTFVSFAQLSGPTFTCTNPQSGDSSGTTHCSIASLAKGDTALFLASYLIDGGAATGSDITDTATISSGTTEKVLPDGNNNTSSATVQVASTPCVLTPPADITTDTTAAGAVVTYSEPTFTGNCGTAPEGETSPISCNPASGSFFPVGTTTVICASQAGPITTFLVKVNNPGTLTISLNGPASITLECGQRFGDPAATAVNGSGQPVEVTVAYSNGFDPDAPAVGTYTGTYTATEGTNSVSTERTITVTDTEAPAITIAGANPYKIQQGSCSPFVDPGASAFDTCGGTKPISSSISGPGGATSVNTSVAGTYIVTYTATDGTHEATATRTVLVGTFPEDEVDQPGTSNVPPTLTLNGDDQMTVECGNGFTDPGATASVCGNSVQVTTTGAVNANAPGTYSITYSATANGFTTEATRIVTVQDTVAPVITLNGANPMQVGFGTTFVDPGATAADGCAGNLTSSILVTGSVNTDVVGFYSLTYTVSDPAGFTDTKVRSVEVLPYNFTGFFAPIDNPPVINEMKAGAAAPVKFSLGGNQGLNIFAAGSPSSMQISCSTSDPIAAVEETETAGQSSLTYDAASDRYKYTWKTENSWKNTCRLLTVTLRDGTVHSAKFKFK